MVIGSLVLVAHPVMAAITYSDMVDLPIPTNFDGIYIDLDTGTGTPGGGGSGTAETNSFTFGSAPVSGWDLNLFFGGIGIAHSNNFQPFRDDTADNLSFIHNVSLGTVVDAASAAANTLGLPGFGGSGRSNGSTVGESHFGVGANYFEPGTAGYMAFVLDQGGTPQYGWMKVTLKNDGTTGTVHEWAFSSDPIEVGMIPEPSAWILVASGIVAGVSRRRRRARSGSQSIR